LELNYRNELVDHESAVARLERLMGVSLPMNQKYDSGHDYQDLIRQVEATRKYPRAFAITLVAAIVLAVGSLRCDGVCQKSRPPLNDRHDHLPAAGWFAHGPNMGICDHQRPFGSFGAANESCRRWHAIRHRQAPVASQRRTRAGAG